MASQIPPQAAAWMAEVLVLHWTQKGTLWWGSRFANLESLKLSLSTTLDCIKKDELVDIWKQMEKLRFVHIKRQRLRNPRYLRKMEMIEEMQKYFLDETLSAFDNDAMTELSAATLLLQQGFGVPPHVQPSVPAVAALPVAAAPPPPASAAPAHNHIPPDPLYMLPHHATPSSTHQPHSHMNPADPWSAPSVSRPTAAASASSHHSPHGTSPQSVSATSVSPRQQLSSAAKRGVKRPAPTESPSHAHPSLTAAAVSAATVPSPPRAVAPAATTVPSPPRAMVTVKREAEIDLLEDDPAVPRDEQESRLLRELEENMGFGQGCKLEILTAIRRLKFNQEQMTGSAQSLTGETVMLHIISHREEMEEAKKMDQARIESERLRKEESARRRKALAEEAEAKLQTATLDAWRTDRTYFSSSWILNHNVAFDALQSLMSQGHDAENMIKHPLLRLLKAERDAQKWYKVLPQAYFETVVCHKICNRPQPFNLSVSLNVEADKIRKAMNSLGEQEGGVPRLFLAAHDAARQTAAQGTGGSGNNNDDGDDDVVLMVDPPPIATAAIPTQNTAAPPLSAPAPNNEAATAGLAQLSSATEAALSRSLHEHDVIDLLGDD